MSATAHVFLLTGSLLALLAAPAQAVGVRAIEIGPDNVHELPGGREADGIIGDFVLANDRIKAVVSGNLHQRKANMATHWTAPTPGCIYDLTPIGAANDQITLFAPGDQRGQLSSVRILKDGSNGEAVIRAELTPAAGGGLGRTHDYILKPGWRGVVVVSTYHNATKNPRKIKPAPLWTGLQMAPRAGKVETGLCHDPADKISYAWAPIEWDGARPAVPRTGEKEVSRPRH